MAEKIVLESGQETRPAAPPENHREAALTSRDPREYLRSRPRARWLLIGAILLVVVGGIWFWRYLITFESTDDAQIDGHLMPLSARISGYVIQVNVDDNQFVDKGTVLVEIDPKDYQVALDKARADLTDAEATARSLNINVPIMSVNTSSQWRSARSDIENTKAGVTAAMKQSAAAEAQLEEAEANDVKAQNDLVRYKQLVDKQEVSQQIYDQALAAAKASAASVAAARASASAAEQQVTQARSRLEQAQANLRAAETGPQQVASTQARALSAEATVKQKQAALELAELNLLYTKLVSPVSGVVMKSVEVGMNIQPGQQLLAIVTLDDVWVTANFKETQLKYMRPGQPAEIKLDANGRTYKGHVDSIAGSSGARLSLLPPENATGNYVKVVQRVPVKIVLDPGQNTNHYLRLGMSVEPKVKVK